MSGLPATARVTAVVVLYRSARVIGDCLRSLEAGVRAGFVEVIAVDNASPDDSANLVEREFPWVRLIRTGENLGFAGGVNRGLRVASTEYLALVNPDAVAPPGCLESLVRYLQEHPAVGLVGPRVVRSSGGHEVSASYRPTYANEIVESLGLFVLGRWFKGLRSRSLLEAPVRPVAVDVLSGCFLVFPRRILEQVGEFDESFFMYVEDVDWCLRVRDAGYEVHYVPECAVVHARSEGGTNESLTLMDGGGNLERLFRKRGIPHSPRGLRWVRRAHYLLSAGWLLVRAAGGRRGAATEARRAWASLWATFRPTQDPRGAR